MLWNQVKKLRHLLALLALSACVLVFFFVDSVTNDEVVIELVRTVSGGAVATLLGVLGALVVIGSYSDADRLRSELLANMRSILEHGAEVVASPLIRELLKEARSEGNSYAYIGNVGTHFTSVTLSELSKRADQGSSVTINAQIIDPASVEACTDYSQLKGHRETERVQKELLATLVICWFFSNLNPRLDFKQVSLRPFSSNFRIDFGSNIAIATTEPKDHPAVAFREKKHFHTQFHVLTKALVESAPVKKVYLKGDAVPKHSYGSIEYVNEHDVDNLLKFWRLNVQSVDGRRLCAEVLGLVKQRKSQYG